MMKLCVLCVCVCVCVPAWASHDATCVPAWTGLGGLITLAWWADHVTLDPGGLTMSPCTQVGSPCHPVPRWADHVTLYPGSAYRYM